MQRGPVVPVELRVPAKLEELLTKQGNPVPDPLRGPGLIDTGASISMVDEGAIAKLEIAPVGTTNLGTAGGQAQCALYPVRLSIVAAPNQVVLAAEFASITSGPLHLQNLLCLIGRDILRHAVFFYDGSGCHFTVSF